MARYEKVLDPNPKKAAKWEKYVYFLFLFICVLPYLLFILFICVSDTIGDEAKPYIPYSLIQHFNFQHHISYNGYDYYLIGSGVPDEYYPFASEPVKVTLVDKNGTPYDEERTEEAWVYENDTEGWFIFYNSDPYTRDKSILPRYPGQIE